jgi:hypothetical protein
LRTRFNEKATSAAVSGVLSENFTPERSLKVKLLPSADCW